MKNRNEESLGSSSEEDLGQSNGEGLGRGNVVENKENVESQGRGRIGHCCFIGI